jgi:hypothetical protein
MTLSPAGETVMSDDALNHPRARYGRAPDVFRAGGWVPMREYRNNEAVDFVIVGTGAGGGTLACKLAEHGFSVVALDAGLVSGVHYVRDGAWQFQRARNVVVAGYAIETPRLLLNSATDKFRDGLANSSGLVGKNLMTQSNQAVWDVTDDEVRSRSG